MTGGSADQGKSIQRSVRRQTYSQRDDRPRLLVEHRRAHLADLARAEPLDKRERLSGVGDVVGDQHPRVVEVDEVGHRRQDHRDGQALVDPGVELDVHRERVLHVERVGERAGDEQAAARDAEDQIGLEAVVGDRLPSSRAAVPSSAQLIRSRGGACISIRRS